MSDIGKSITPETGGGERESQHAPITAEITATKKRPRSATSGGGLMSKRIPPKASIYTELTRERAEKLATLRRGRLNEFTWASISGLAASIPSTTHSWAEVMAKPEFSLSFPQAIDFAVSLIFLVLLTVALVSGQNRGLTSMQYLERHFGADPDAEPSRPLFRRLFART